MRRTDLDCVFGCEPLESALCWQRAPLGEALEMTIAGQKLSGPGLGGHPRHVKPSYVFRISLRASGKCRSAVEMQMSARVEMARSVGVVSAGGVLYGTCAARPRRWPHSSHHDGRAGRVGAGCGGGRIVRRGD